MKTVIIFLLYFGGLNPVHTIDYKLMKSECEVSEKKTLIMKRCDVDGKFFNIEANITRPLGLNKQINVCRKKFDASQI